ncbi:MAG: hypothetical protein HYY02_06260 [Chloroflexi bacterium]|nr:hypothetical protein [Chloroflexota bacterium]
MNAPLDLNQPLEPQFEEAEDKERFFHELTTLLGDMEVGVEEGFFPPAVFEEFSTQYKYLMARYRHMTGNLRATTPAFQTEEGQPSEEPTT